MATNWEQRTGVQTKTMGEDSVSQRKREKEKQKKEKKANEKEANEKSITKSKLEIRV